MIDITSLIDKNDKRAIEIAKLPLYKKSPKQVSKAFEIFKEEYQKIDFFKAIWGNVKITLDGKQND